MTTPIPDSAACLRGGPLRRAVAAGAVLALHVVAIYALANANGEFLSGISPPPLQVTLIPAAVAAAVDTRIQYSFPAAGSLPTYLRPTLELGDWEQREFPGSLYTVANYLDLYLLGAMGEGRAQVQVLNVYDSVAFAGEGYRTYLPLLADISGGQFAAHWPLQLLLPVASLSNV